MTKPNSGGPAFPRPTVYYQRHDGAFVTEEGEPGISLRAYAAIKIMPEIIHRITDEDMAKGDVFTVASGCAKAAVRFADALIRELEKENLGHVDSLIAELEKETT